MGTEHRRTGISLAEIASRLQMDLEIARRYAASLCLGKYKALRKSNDKEKKTVGDEELLCVNEKLATDILDKRTRRPKPRIGFPVPKAEAQRQKAEEGDASDMAVQEERKYAIEASVVRCACPPTYASSSSWIIRMLRYAGPSDLTGGWHDWH
jgi:hypothetical protein